MTFGAKKHERPCQNLETQNLALGPGTHNRQLDDRSARTPLGVVLSTAGSGGTIAAVRHLRARGLDVGVLSSDRLAAASWSKTNPRDYWAPPESASEQFIERLMEIGAAKPGQILLATSDQTAWLYAANAERLKQHFLLYQPSRETMERILTKSLFQDAVRKAGLSVLPSWQPRSLEELEALAPALSYPILIKPCTHVHRVRNNKGIVAHSSAELVEQYRQFVNVERFRESDSAMDSDSKLPILQQLVSVAQEGVCSVTGFIDRTGELFVARRAKKVFQRSQPVGVGVCFESLPDDRDLFKSVRRLCRELKYFGLFEVEFLRFNGKWNAIDFNGRLFNQIGMDIRRGMPLPFFACLDAAGETAALRAAVKNSQAQPYAPAAFCDRFTFHSILLARTITGRISGDELSHWLEWRKRHANHSVDFALDADDPIPGVIHALSDTYLGVKSLRRFLNSIPRNPGHALPTEARASI